MAQGLRPAFTPPADRPVELRYGKEVGDGNRFAVAVGGLRYRIVPKGPGRWQVTEVVADAEGEEEETYLLDGLGSRRARTSSCPRCGTPGEARWGA